MCILYVHSPALSLQKLFIVGFPKTNGSQLLWYLKSRLFVNTESSNDLGKPPLISKSINLQLSCTGHNTRAVVSNGDPWQRAGRSIRGCSQLSQQVLHYTNMFTQHKQCRLPDRFIFLWGENTKICIQEIRLVLCCLYPRSEECDSEACECLWLISLYTLHCSLMSLSSTLV